MNLAHMMGWGMLFASSWGLAAGDPPACSLPTAATLHPARPLTQKFSLALGSCAQAPAAEAAQRQAAQLQLYDDEADAPLAMLPPAKAAAPVPPVPAAAPAATSPAPAAPKPPQRLSGTQRRVLALAPDVQRVATAYDIDPLLLHAIAHVESRHNPRAVSPAGALGLMQVMPATARRFGVSDPQRSLFDPRVSLEAASAYLKTLQGRFGNNLALVLAAYNAGEGAVEKHRRPVPPFAETQRYVKEVLAEYLSLKAALR